MGGDNTGGDDCMIIAKGVRTGWVAKRAAFAVLVPLASLDIAAAFATSPCGLRLRAAGAANPVSRCATSRIPLRASAGEDEDETQTNTGRFHKFADFDHDGMDDKQFRCE